MPRPRRGFVYSTGSCRQRTEPSLQAGAGAAGEVAIRWDMGKCVARYVDGEQANRALYGAFDRGYGSVGEDSKCISTISGASVREWRGRIVQTACRLACCHQLQWAATSATLHRSWHRHGLWARAFPKLRRHPELFLRPLEKCPSLNRTHSPEDARLPGQPF